MHRYTKHRCISRFTWGLQARITTVYNRSEQLPRHENSVSGGAEVISPAS